MTLCYEDAVQMCSFRQVAVICINGFITCLAQGPITCKLVLTDELQAGEGTITLLLWVR